jgi:phosphate starvation-inducible PhoH-like protein
LDLVGNLEGVGTIFLTADDVVRHRLVKDIIRAFERDAERKQKQRMAEEE